MKKNYLLLLLLVITSISFAQIPTGYYDTATGTGYALKTQLKKIINKANDGLSPEYLHVDKGYAGLWTAYSTTDRDNAIGYDDDNTIIDIYSENPGGGNNDPYNYTYNTSQCGNYSIEGDCYNREHLIPQSYFGHNNSGPQLSIYQIMKDDVQHIYPTDGKVNGTRSDYAFGKVNVASFTSKNGSKLGSALNSDYSAGFSGTVFEPIDEFKGDIARVFLYFATRYEDDMDELYNSYTTVDARVMFDGSTDKVFNSTFLNILLTWNYQDPVSTKEIVRNNAAFVHQNNRNPYIDHPEYVCRVWGAAACALGNDEFALTDIFKIYPNPSNGKFNIDFQDYGNYAIEILSVIGQKVLTLQENNKKNIEINHLQQGVYLIKITKDSKSIVKKIVIN